MFYDKRARKIQLSDDINDNFINIAGLDRYLSYLTEAQKTGKGGNSFVFRLKDYNEEDPTLIIKICKSYTQSGAHNSFFFKKQLARFEREIEALKVVENSGINNFLVKIIADGTLKLDGASQEEENGYSFRYYVMEEAECDLAEYLSSMVLTLDQKMLLCFQVIDAFNKLHEIGIYHRDIKPDNIFLFNDDWKIGDLGLINMRDIDQDLDFRKEKIGPYGYLSPEALNKALGNRDIEGFSFDCDIDDKSDVFQIGKLIWFILQGEVPSGNLSMSDFKEKEIIEVFEKIIFPSLQFSKQRRPDIKKIQESFAPMCEKRMIL